MSVYCGRTADSVVDGVWGGGRVGLWYHVLDGGFISQQEEANFGGNWLYGARLLGDCGICRAKTAESIDLPFVAVS